MAYKSSAGSVVVALQATAILSLRHLFSQHNKRIVELKSETHNRPDDPGMDATKVDAFSSELQEEIKNHVALSDALGTLNQVFEVSVS